MRTIKFRFWNIKEQKIFSWEDLLKHAKNFDRYDSLISHFNNPEAGVLMQFTNLKDDRGADIYEGDLIKTEFGVGMVAMDDKGRWGVEYEDDRFYDFAYGIDYKMIVGIFWETPELLE